MYNTESLQKTIKIPVRIVNGNVKYFYGGELPEIKEGMIGELILPEYAVLDGRFIEISQMEDRVQILPSGNIVMIGVNRSNVPELLQKNLKQLPMAWKSRDLAIYEEFVEVVLKDPLYLQIRGSKKPSLMDVKCSIVSLDLEASSLNNAYSIVSTNFEPHRKSHTGNVFQKCFYKSKDDWYTLEGLRDNEVAKLEEKFFLDYKLFELNEDNLKFNTKLENSEKLLVEEIKKNKFLTGKEIKKLFKKDKKDYIEVINNLLSKNIINDIKDK